MSKLCHVVVKYGRIVANDYFGASKLLFLNQIVVIVVIVIENTHYKGAIFLCVAVASYGYLATATPFFTSPIKAEKSRLLRLLRLFSLDSVGYTHKKMTI